jgi:hypothetical protein
MTTVSLKLPEELLREVAAEAQRRGVSKSAVIRQQVEAGLRRTGRARTPVTCAELAAGLIGSLSGPVDLSTNQAYLDAAVWQDAQRGRRRNRRHR